MAVLAMVGKATVVITAAMLIALAAGIGYAAKKVAESLNRPITCPECIVGLLHKNEYSDRVTTLECNNCDYSRLVSDYENNGKKDEGDTPLP